jgi:hypothetical protein
MEVRINKMEKAIVQLDKAVELFLSKDDPILSITLAGAAEEVLGNMIERDGRKATHSQGKFNLSSDKLISEKEINDKYTNKIKNWLKHAGDPIDDEIDADPELEAIQYIIRGISNYLMLKGQIKKRHIDFLNFIKINYPEIFKDMNQVDYDTMTISDKLTDGPPNQAV